MTFQDIFNDYITKLDCTGKELAAASGVAPSVISRYRTGVRVPDRDGEQIRRLAAGIAALAAERGMTDITAADAESALRQALASEQETLDRESFRRNLNDLLEAFAVGNRELARALSFDASHVARIRSGQRTPGDAAAFALNTGHYIVRRCQSAEERARLAALIGTELPADADSGEHARAVARYLLTGGAPSDADGIGAFLRKMDDFDLDEYIRVIHFDEMKTPAAPIQLPSSRVYTGLKELMDGQIDFLKTTVLSRSDGEVTMYSDMPMTEMSQDPEFPKKWMFGMATMLKKGLHLNMIHNMDRPFHEMMLGLESWIPMYMTGQISPYYLSGTQSSPFRHMLWVSGAAALQGDCVTGHLRDGRILLTSRKNDVAHYQKRAAQLLSRASPLMEIYDRERKTAYDRFLTEDSVRTGARRSILSTLPIYSLSDALARRILARTEVPEADQAIIFEHIQDERQRMDSILQHSVVTDTLPEIAEDEYSKWPVSLSLSEIFYPGDIRLTYEEYAEYLTLCDTYAEAHPGYSCVRDKNTPFRNIQITILENERVVVSKNTSPAIHFVIHHPRMIEAIENMVMPITD